MGDIMDGNGKGDESNVIPIETVKGASASNKKSKRDPINAILGKRPSGKQLRETLKEALPIEKAKRPNTEIGRPTKYDEQIGENVLALMADGYTVTEAADRLGINRSTIYRWSEQNASFASLLARAKHLLAEHAFTQSVAIPRELYSRVLAGEDISGPAVASARLYSDALRWHAELLNRAAYGAHSKQSIELSGTIATASVLIDSSALSQSARDALRYALLAANAAPIIEGEGVDE
jgi:transposase-like protein